MFRNNFKRKQNKRNCGFTIVEMVVVIPLIIVLVGVFITTIIGMTGDVLGNRASNVLSYDIQSALDRISNDVTRSGAFLSANNISVSSPQRYDDDDTGFTNVGANGTMLILNEYTTTQDPLNSSREPVYVSYKPYSCSSEYVSENQILMVNIVYFVKDNALWRRVIAPSNYISLGCSTPYQQPTCAPGVSGTLCKTEDIKVIDDVEAGGFSVEYYPNPNSDSKDNVADDPSKTDSERQTALSGNSTVKVTLNVARTVAGREFSQTSSIRSVSQNNNPDATFPDCPTGFIIVPGSDTYGTSDFCVMKYEAKADDNGDGIGDTSQTTGYNTWPVNTYPISATRKLVSTAAGYPVANISQTTSISAASSYTANCASGCHLITEAEWMTIAQNVLSVPGNWSGGSVGSGYIYSGHNDNVPATAIEADVSDTNGYVNTGNTSGNQKRTLTLTNGEVIWDLAGDVYEWTQGTVAGGQQPGLSGESAYAWKQWNNGSLLMNGLPALSQPGSTGISGITWNSSSDIGQLYSNYGEAAARAFLRGGYWGDGSDAGVLALNLSGSSGDTSSRLGLRVSR